MTFCWVPAGDCQLGSPKAERDAVLIDLKETKEPDWLLAESEERRGKFSTKGFWMGKYEVTQAEWTAIMKGVAFNGEDIGTPSYFRAGGAEADKVKGIDTSRFPVETVSWEQCQEFVKRSNAHGGIVKAFGKPGKFALPHEDQWEYACRGGLGYNRPFYWGASLNGSQANSDGKYPFGTSEKGNYFQRTCAVDETNGGSYPVHPWGLCHMHGNVWEWCENTYDQTNSRVLRGGSWIYYSWNCRAAYRVGNAPGRRFFGNGCRVVLSLD